MKYITVQFEGGPYDGKTHQREYAHSVIVLPYPITPEEATLLVIDNNTSWRTPEAVYEQAGKNQNGGVRFYKFARRVDYKPDPKEAA